MKRWYLAVMTVSIMLLGVGMYGNLPVKIIYNPTESVPKGYYFILNSLMQKGDYVLADIPKYARELAAERQYLPANILVIKPIAAISGDHICVKNGQVFINNKPMARLLKQDSRSRNLRSWKGCRVIKEEEFFLLSTYSPVSYDSRYFGPVARKMIIGKAVPLLIFNSK